MPDIKVRVGQQNAVKVVASAFGGSLTAERAQYATNVTGGIASVTALDVTGISTLGGSLYVAGITTLAANGGITTTGGDFYVGRDLYVDQLKVTGVSTLTGNVNLGGNVDRLAVTGVSTFYGATKFDTADVVFQGNSAGQNITFDASENDLEFTDLARIKFGNSDDLEIWHGSNNSHIKNSTNDLKIRSDSLILKRADDSEAYLKATVNSDVKIYYNGNEKFATISTGATVTGDLYVSGDLNVIGDLVYDEVIGRNLHITGLSTFVGITTQQSTLFATDVSVAGVTTFNGDVNFPGASYHIHWDQPTSKFKFDDSAQCVWGSASGGDLRIWHASDTSNIKNETGELRIASNDLRLQTQNNSEDYLLAVDGGSVSIFHNDIKRLETTASGVDITNTLNVSGISTFNDSVRFPDDKKLHFGNIGGTVGDLQIWHDAGQHSYIRDQGSGDLRIYGSAVDIRDNGGTSSVARFTDDGVDVTGNLNVAGVSTFVGIVTTSSDLYVGGDLYIKDDLEFDEFTARNIKVTGVSTFVGDAQFDGNVSIGGTLTYEDVTNIDSVGLITARSGVRITDGGLVVTAGVSTFGGDITASTYYVADNIRHTGDTDTYIEFNDDKIRLMAGGKGILTVQEASVDTVIVNDGSNNCDFRVEGLNDEYLIFSDGGTDTVGIGSAIPTAKLDVAGDLNVSGILTATQLTGLIDGGTY